MAYPLPTFRDLRDFLRTSKRLTGKRVLLGRTEQASEVSPGTVKILPTTGNLGGKKQDQQNLYESPVTLECECWGTDLDDAWALLSLVANTLYEYRVARDVEIIAGGVSFSTDTDTATQGEAVTGAFTIRLVVEKMSGDGDDAVGTGNVQKVQFQDPNGNVASPTLPFP